MPIGCSRRLRWESGCRRQRSKSGSRSGWSFFLREALNVALGQMLAADAVSTKLQDRLTGLFRNRRRPAIRFGAVHRNHRKVGRFIRRSFCERNRAQSGIVSTILRLSAGSIVTRLLVSSIGLSSVVLNVLATIDRPHIALVGVFNANRQKLNVPSVVLNRSQRGTKLGSGT